MGKKSGLTEIRSALSWAEIRATTATSLGTAFGIVIGFIWTNVVTSAFATAGIPITAGTSGWSGWLIFLMTAVVVTLICVVGILILGRWARKK